MSNVGLENIPKRKSFSKKFAILKEEGLLECLTRPGWHVVTFFLMCASVGSEDLINSPTKNYLLYIRLTLFLLEMKMVNKIPNKLLAIECELNLVMGSLNDGYVMSRVVPKEEGSA